MELHQDALREALIRKQENKRQQDHYNNNNKNYRFNDKTNNIDNDNNDNDNNNDIAEKPKEDSVFNEKNLRQLVRLNPDQMVQRLMEQLAAEDAKKPTTAPSHIRRKILTTLVPRTEGI